MALVTHPPTWPLIYIRTVGKKKIDAYHLQNLYSPKTLFLTFLRQSIFTIFLLVSRSLFDI